MRPWNGSARWSSSGSGSREVSDPGRARDRYERDSTLQADTSRAYRRLAETSWRSPWTILGAEPDVHELADVVVGL